MKKYEVFWFSFILGTLSIGSDICKYEPSEIVSEVAKSVIIDPILIARYEGEEIPTFFKKFLECLEKSEEKEFFCKYNYIRIREV